MAITHSTAVRNAATDAVVDLLDVGAGANGTLEILDDTIVLAILPLSEPAFGASASGTATAAAITADASADASGTADKWKLKDEDGTLCLDGQAGMKRAISGTATTGLGGSVQTAGDHTTEFAAGTDFTIVGSTGNDGSWTVASSSYAAGVTTIVVEKDQNIPSAVADGYVHVGQLGLDNTSITAGQNVSCSSLTYTALPT